VSGQGYQGWGRPLHTGRIPPHTHRQRRWVPANPPAARRRDTGPPGSEAIDSYWLVPTPQGVHDGECVLTCWAWLHDGEGARGCGVCAARVRGVRVCGGAPDGGWRRGEPWVPPWGAAAACASPPSPRRTPSPTSSPCASWRRRQAPPAHPSPGGSAPLTSSAQKI
jgi:hypothetical protein